MKLIVGLGNVGPEYEVTRHNIGFIILDQFALAKKASLQYKDRFRSFIGEWKVDELESVIIAKPATFVNRSGWAVLMIAKYYGVSESDILVVLDDVALPLGSIRARAQGSDGGHNGMTSIIQSLNTEAVARLRIGVGRPSSEEQLSDYVLSPFTDAELESLKDVFIDSVNALADFSKNGIEYIMNFYNKRLGE